MHQPTHKGMQKKTGTNAKVYDTTSCRWYIKEKKLSGGFVQYNLSVENEVDAAIHWRNKGRILRVLNRKKKIQAVELSCDTGTYLVVLPLAFKERFPPELRTEISLHESNTERNAFFCSKYF